jgi:hypothetical protein
MLPHQDFKDWQQSPMQGAMPALQHQSLLTDADEYYLQETLVECRVKLESALRTAQHYSRLPDLAIALADALTSCNEALSITSDPSTYLE